MHDQRGMSLSPFVAVVVPALLVMIGLVVDGGAQATAARQAERVAGAAARAATDSAAGVRLAGRPNLERAAAAARATISAEPGVSGEVQVRSGRVVVKTVVVTQTLLLNLIGIAQLSASGSAEAELLPDR